MISPLSFGSTWIDPDPAAAPLVRFEDRADRRQAAVVGVIEVGELGPCVTGGLFYWRLWLPGCPSFGRCGCAKAARDHLTSRIEQWIEAADLKSAKV